MALLRADDTVAEHFVRPLCPFIEFAGPGQVQVSG
jgi:hypothetical protein